MVKCVWYGVVGSLLVVVRLKSRNCDGAHLKTNAAIKFWAIALTLQKTMKGVSICEDYLAEQNV